MAYERFYSFRMRSNTNLTGHGNNTTHFMLQLIDKVQGSIECNSRLIRIGGDPTVIALEAVWELIKGMDPINYETERY